MLRFRLLLLATCCLALATSTIKAEIIYVDDSATGANDGSSWCDAFTSLQDGLAAATEFDVIRVAQGVYKPDQGSAQIPGDMTATFQFDLDFLTLEGGYAGCGSPDANARDVVLYETVLSGDLLENDPEEYQYNDPLWSDNSYHVLTLNYGIEVVDGFTITHGNAADGAPYPLGSGALILSSAENTFRACRFVNNSRQAIYSLNGDLIFDECSFLNNESGLLVDNLHATGGFLSITHCLFSHNGWGFYLGGGFQANHTSIVNVNASLFLDNYAWSGGAIRIERTHQLTINDSIFLGNIGDVQAGGAIYIGPPGDPPPIGGEQVSIANCLFSGNEASPDGSALYIGGGPSSVSIINSTIAHNNVRDKAGAAVAAIGASTSLAIVNSILWQNASNTRSSGTVNESTQVHVENGSLAVSYSIIDSLDQLSSFPGNLGADPLFVSAAGVDGQHGTEDDDLHLQAGSPAIDSGTNDVPDLPEEDLDGTPRIQHCGVDMGAYEAVSPPSTDCQLNGIPDECEGVSDWIGPDGGSFTSPANWSLGVVPDGHAAMINTANVDNTAVLSAPGDMHICSVTIHSLGTGNQIMRVNAGSALDANLETAVDSGGRIELAGGALSTSELDILGTTARVGGYGTVTGDITNSGIVTGSVLGVLVLDGGSFTNGVGAFLTAPFGSFVVVQSNSVSQSGQIEVDASAGLLVDQPLVNSPGATISILGGSLATLQLTNQSSADVEGFGLIQADVTNAGDIVLISDTEVVGNVQNDGTITIQNGLLTITGTLSGSGTIYGDFSGPGPVPGVAGLTVISDVMLAADSTLTIANGLVRVGGSFDVAINDPAGLDLTTTTVQLVGLPEDLQTLETPAADFGSTVTLPDADLYSLATLRIGPTPAVVKLVDDHDNSPGAGSEALYVEGLVLDDGITLDLNGLRIYYGAVTPEDPFNPGSGVTIIDSVGGGDLIPLSSCVAFSDCADLDDNGVRDDACVWWGCNGGACAGTDIVFADMGGAFGACAPDGTADGNDRFHALNCFSDSNTQGAPGYPCEVNPPVAYNVDAGGPFGNCSPDGVCDGNDAFHAINAFSGVNTCSCPLDGGPGPDTPSKPGVVAFAGLRLVANPSLARSGGVVEVEVYLDGDLPDIRGYQLHLGVSGGNAGRLELVDIAVHDRKDAVFAGLAPWRAFNIQTGQMVAGLDSAGIAAPAGAYLATFTFQVSADAAGAFTIELLHDENDRSQRTFLFPTPTGAKIQIESVKPAVVTVEPASEQARRAR